MRARRPGEATLLLLDVAQILEAHKIRYAVVGAMAATVHGVVRASVDADAVLALSVSGLAALEPELARAGWTCELRRGDATDPIAAVLEVSDRHGNRVDLLVGLRGLEAAAFERAVRVPFQGSELPVAGREDFIAMKVYARERQDIADAEHVLEACSGPLDLELLRRLAARDGAAARQLEALLGAG
jgi:hypothetical protein